MCRRCSASTHRRRRRSSHCSGSTIAPALHSLAAAALLAAAVVQALGSTALSWTKRGSLGTVMWFERRRASGLEPLWRNRRAVTSSDHRLLELLGGRCSSSTRRGGDELLPPRFWRRVKGGWRTCGRPRRWRRACGVAQRTQSWPASQNVELRVVCNPMTALGINSVPSRSLFANRRRR